MIEHELNKVIADKYGKADDGKPKFRLILNDDTVREHRYMTEGKVIHGVDVPKYSYIPLNVWILEKLEYNAHDDLDLQSYEPRWVFMTNEGKRLEPNLRAVILLIESILRGAQEVMSEDEQKEKAESEAFEVLGGNAGISDALILGEGIQVPSNYEKGN